MSISLKSHNEATYTKVIEKMEESNKVAVIQPTGTGKMFIALKLLEENNDKKAIYLAPANSILHDVKKNIFSEGMTMEDFPLLKRMTYQKLARLTDEEIENLDADIIILDEFHHCGAPEWGSGVERLIQRNENAKILGLSATPLRYLDGLRDMSDELFENNIASEMSLEEAIESGILPSATYVSTLYGYENELDNLQKNIYNIKDEDKKQQAQNLLNELRGKLDVNTDNLLDIFSKYMKNPNGKYIIFCKNLEDMNEKIEQAQEMFGTINPNITVRAVSSKIKESEEILTEFEEDNEEGTLKLLYSINMINEGYHINDLDGVIMMRPTYSPTIFTQQLGRALTVGRDKNPVVLDLVNNFDSCKIIEDFVEKMRQGKVNDGTEKRNEAKSRISIFDKTREFREIAKKITKLSSRKGISLEEKIQIFEKFSQTGEELVGNTIFEGYPIGFWAIQIRCELKRVNNGKDEKRVIYPTEEQLERLEKLGILERKIDSNIDEKIDSLIEWIKKYPKATITPIISKDVLREYAKNEENIRELEKEYEKNRKYYDYIRGRKCKGALTEEQIEKCKEGNVGGVFENSTKFEIETNELIKKYGLDEQIIKSIRRKFGSIDEFRKIYINALINGTVDKDITKEILNNVNLVSGIDFNSPDLVIRKKGSVKLLCDLFSNAEYSLINSEGFEENVIGLIKNWNCNERDKKILFMSYGINNETLLNSSDIANECHITETRVKQIIEKCLRGMRYPAYLRYLDIHNVIFDYDDMDYDLKKEFFEEYFKNFDIFVSKEPTSIEEDIKIKFKNMVLEAKEKTKKRSEQVGIIRKMSNEQKNDILKARFGEKISSSNSSVLPPWHYVYEKYDGEYITEELEISSSYDDIFKECIDSEYTQSKIFEYLLDNFYNIELTDMEKIKELEKRINSSKYISEEQKKKLIKLLYKPFNVPIDDAQDIQDSEFLEKNSKEELIKNILEQQKTIAEQRKKINELSSKKMEEV